MVDAGPLKCTSCGASLPPPPASGGSGWLTCSFCLTLNRAPSRRAASEAEAAPAPAIRPRPAIPAGITVEETGGELVITRRWFHFVAFFLVFFTIAWDAFMAFWFYTALSEGIWIMALFGMAHGAVGLGLAYFTACLFVNRTVIRVSRARLEVRHVPLPWRGAGAYPVQDLRQLFTKEKVTQGKNGPSRSYSLMMIDAAGREQKLVSGLAEPEQALFLEDEIERFLHLRDEAVAGEHKPR